ncbi:MAG: hypothetical protein IPJ74_01345 [Saprospiraceae bacterium]|nr:hypothetical protein [Saprospiraceae bacterium]
MLWKLEHIKDTIATAPTEAALDTLSRVIGAYPPFVKDEFYFLSARWNGLKKKSQINEWTEYQILWELSEINEGIQALITLMEKESRLPVSIHPNVMISEENEKKETILLIFVSEKKKIRQYCKISPYQSVGYLKKTLIRQFGIDTSTPLDSDNPKTYLVVNRTPLINERLTLLEAGLKNKDIIQINVEFHIKMIWSQAIPTRVRVTFIGLTFTKPSIIINNVQKAKLISLTEDEVEAEFYTYSLSATVKKLFIDFRFLDGDTRLEFQEVVHPVGKVIDLQRVSKKSSFLPISRKYSF